jgi:predicted GNAT superfamily acetyltransferase
MQEEVWGTLALGCEVLGVIQKYGGVVLGALQEGEMVGFLVALLARRHGRLVHWSHMMAVREGFRDLGLGFQMKLAHRKLALEQGIKSICWTYDPLQSRNAALNLRRLGATVEEYIPNCYGRFPSMIEKGLPSDRFVVNWKIGSTAVEHRLGAVAPDQDFARIQRTNDTQLNPRSFVENSRIRLSIRAPRLLVEIPANTDAMRAKDSGLALRWRMETRRIFQHYLRVGYRVADFIAPSAATGRRCFYVLCK